MAAISTSPVLVSLDDLRHLATRLAVEVGVAPARASAFSTHLLWFDAVGASSHGIAALPEWLERIDRKEIDPIAEGRIGPERAGTAVFDARNGIPPLALERAAGVASEKARELGIGMVHVRNLGPTGPAAPIASHLAIGPFIASVVGPDGSEAMAWPSAEGLPIVVDTRLGGQVPNALPRHAIIPDGKTWVIQAISVTAFESFGSFIERSSGALSESGTSTGRIVPLEWEARRREVRERGLSVDSPTWLALQTWAERLGVAWPASLGDLAGGISDGLAAR